MFTDAQFVLLVIILLCINVTIGLGVWVLAFIQDDIKLIRKYITKNNSLDHEWSIVSFIRKLFNRTGDGSLDLQKSNDIPDIAKESNRRIEEFNKLRINHRKDEFIKSHTITQEIDDPDLPDGHLPDGE